MIKLARYIPFGEIYFRTCSPCFGSYRSPFIHRTVGVCFKKRNKTKTIHFVCVFLFIATESANCAQRLGPLQSWNQSGIGAVGERLNWERRATRRGHITTGLYKRLIGIDGRWCVFCWWPCRLCDKAPASSHRSSSFFIRLTTKQKKIPSPKYARPSFLFFIFDLMYTYCFLIVLIWRVWKGESGGGGPCRFIYIYRIRWILWDWMLAHKRVSLVHSIARLSLSLFPRRARTL